MTTRAAAPIRDVSAAGVILLVGIILAAFAEAVAGTALSLGRGDIIGDVFATPDEFAWLDISYTTMKFIGFVIAAWIMARIGAGRLIVIALCVMSGACALAAVTTRLDVLTALRAIQGFTGGILLVVGQTIIFLVFPKHRQPFLQAMFAIGAVVAPATIAPVLEGWLLDNRSWSWVFFSVVPVSLTALGLLLIAELPALSAAPQQVSDWIGLALIAAFLFCLTYVLSQGSRWNWFDEPRIVWLTMLGAAGLFSFTGWRRISRVQAIPQFTAFQSTEFSFAFIVSFVAGAALFGSAYLIPSFATSVLLLTPTAAGLLLLPSGGVFVLSLLIAAFLIQTRGVSPIAMAPFGIVMIMAAMWMLSGSTSESGADDMTVAVLIRGFGLGFLFLALTLIAFNNLPSRSVASAIGLFNIGRQIGGLLGIAGLQTLIDHQVATNFTALSANLSAGMPAVSERLFTTRALLTTKGLDIAAAERASISMLERVVNVQATVIAFDSAFIALALLFVFAAPLVVTIKICLGRIAKAQDSHVATAKGSVY